MTSLSSLTVDELADGICVRAGRIAAAQAELLLWIAEFDRREGWAGPGMLSCAHWLSWRVGMSLGTARDQVRVARRLPELPQVAAAFGEGRVSYSKVRAITRAAEPDDRIDWVDLARHASAAQLDKIVRGVQRARGNEAAQRDPEAAAWRLRTRTRYDENGNFVLTITGPAQLLPVVRAGLDARKAQLQRERDAAAQDQRTDEIPPPAAALAGATQAAAPQPAPAQVPPPPAPAAGSPDVDEPHGDEPARGWPPGTTRRQLQEAMKGFSALQARLRAEQTELFGHAPPAAPPSARQPGPQSMTAPDAGSSRADLCDERTGTTEPAAVTDADALLALAQDARGTVPLPWLHPAHQAARPPRRLLEPRRPDRPGGPRPS